MIMVPAGPMSSGYQCRKSSIRRQFAQGKIGREELLKAESAIIMGRALVRLRYCKLKSNVNGNYGASSARCCI